LEKIEHNLFSPTELQILLDGNMEIQRIRKKTLDVYQALMEKVSIGALLYAPAMRNLAVSRHELDDLLMDEEETADEYRREVWAQTARQNAGHSQYELRSKDKLMQKWQIHDGPLLSTLQSYVKSAIRSTPQENLNKWLDKHKVKAYFEKYVKPFMDEDASLITISEDHALSVLFGMFGERVHEKQTRHERAAERNAERQAKSTNAKLRKQHRIVKHQIMTAKGKSKRLKSIPPDEL
jgi:hypothetical protein